jgi:putative glycosyltransferase (TIGR04372 family)
MKNKVPLHVTPLFYSFGNAAEEILWAAARARCERRELRIIPPMRFTEALGFSICNEHLFDLHCDNQSLKADLVKTVATNFQFFASRFGALALKKIFGVRLPEHFFFPRTGLSTCWPFLANTDQTLKYVESDPIIHGVHEPLGISLSTKQRDRADPIIDAMVEGNRFVCLHVRDSGFHNDPAKRPYRNAQIESYRPLIEYLISQGMSVVRLGDPSAIPFQSEIRGFVDYAHSPLRCSLVDLALIERCEYYIGMQSGPLDVAYLFQKPVLILNMYEWLHASPMKTFDRGLLKRAYLKNSGSPLELEERFKLPFRYTNVNARWSENELRFSDNSASEILRAGEEFQLDYLSGFNRTPSVHLRKNRDLFERYGRVQLLSMLSRPEEGYASNPLYVSQLLYKNLSSRGFLY